MLTVLVEALKKRERALQKRVQTGRTEARYGTAEGVEEQENAATESRAPGDIPPKRGYGRPTGSRNSPWRRWLQPPTMKPGALEPFKTRLRFSVTLLDFRLLAGCFMETTKNGISSHLVAEQPGKRIRHGIKAPGKGVLPPAPCCLLPAPSRSSSAYTSCR